MNDIRESLATGTAIFLALLSPVHAADESPWADDIRSAVRLVAAPSRNGELRAGVEMKLQPGWHTYWRYPGDSGVPPQFDFAGSDNLRSARIRFPAPAAFSDEAGTSIGYKDSVIFPLRITPRDPAKPVTLKVNVKYAVCEKLCVPAEGHTALALGDAASTYDVALSAAEAQVPIPVSAQDAGLVAKRVTATLKPLVMLDIAAPKGGAYQVFVEGPNSEWAIPIPKGALGAPPGRRHFEFELDGVPPGVDPMGPFELTFTVVGGERPIEVTTRLD
ncbi:MAG: cytochrome C biogenesis protein [Pseudolabrys sp.]|nr:cytochrome C biogenesis protein [Pseudolabrys sp.]